MKDSKLIYEDLTRNRIVPVHGEINDESASSIIAMLLFLQAEDRHAEINMTINSLGGSVTASLAILDTMEAVTCPIRTLCLDNAVGTAMSILAHGTKGLRSSKKNANISIVPFWGVEKSGLDKEIQRKEIVRLKNIVIDLLAADVSTDRAQIAEDFEEGLEMTPVEALNYGIIDGIEISSAE